MLIRLTYKYHRLVQNSSDKPGELPQVERCAVDEDEEDEDEVSIIGSIIHAFWLVLTYDLEDRRIDDVIIKNFSPLFSKMAESFEI